MIRLSISIHQTLRLPWSAWRAGPRPDQAPRPPRRPAAFHGLKVAGDMSCVLKLTKPVKTERLLYWFHCKAAQTKQERERGKKNGTVPSKTSRSVQNGENNRWRVQRRAQDCVLVAIGFTSPFLASPINEVNSSRFVIVLFRMTPLGSQWHHVTAVKQVILPSPSDWCWSITCVRYHALVFF